MITLAPSLLVAAANALVGLEEQGGDNRGQMVELLLKEVNQQPGAPWCAAFVYHVGYWSHFDHRSGKSSWPLAARWSCVCTRATYALDFSTSFSSTPIVSAIVSSALTLNSSMESIVA